MNRTLVVMLAVAALVAAACGAGGEEDADVTTTEATTEPAADDGAVMFGSLESPCGSGDARVAEGEGPDTEQLVIGVANDRGADAIGRPGLNKELWDASQAFVDWCNEQGGIQGLEVVLVDLDGEAVNVEAAITRACDSVFAMVGGGHVQDQLQFTGAENFHTCGLIDVPAFTVSIQKSGSNGKTEAIPNPADAGATQWVRDFAALYPEQVEKMVVVSGDLPSFATLENLFISAAEFEGIDLLDTVSYPFAGADDWGPYADLVIDSGAESMYFIGAPENAANLLMRLREKRWEGVSLHQTNAYDQLTLSSGPRPVEGMVIRTIFHPFEEADEWPAIADYLELLERVPDAKVASLGLQSISAWLLFATAVNACVELNDGLINRDCILEETAAVDSWDAGGLHAPSNPGGDEPPSCGMLLTIRDGEFERLWPEIGGEGDDLAGFSCPEDSIVTADTSELGEGAVDPSRSR